MAAENKKWAFVSDYARLRILYDQGGIYLDTDMYVLKNFEDLLNYDIFLGYEDNEFINSAVLGSKKNNWLINKWGLSIASSVKLNKIAWVSIYQKD